MTCSLGPDPDAPVGSKVSRGGNAGSTRDELGQDTLKKCALSKFYTTCVPIGLFFQATGSL